MRSKQNITYMLLILLQEKMNQKFKQKIYHTNVNVNVMVKNVIPVKNGVMINVNVSVKNIIYVKKIIFGVLLQAVVKMANI